MHKKKTWILEERGTKHNQTDSRSPSCHITLLRSPHHKNEIRPLNIYHWFKFLQFLILNAALGDDTTTRLKGTSGLDHILLQTDLSPLYTGHPVPSQHILSRRRVGDNVNSAFTSVHTGLRTKRNTRVPQESAVALCHYEQWSLLGIKMWFIWYTMNLNTFYSTHLRSHKLLGALLLYRLGNEPQYG